MYSVQQDAPLIGHKCILLLLYCISLVRICFALPQAAFPRTSKQSAHSIFLCLTAISSLLQMPGCLIHKVSPELLSIVTSFAELHHFLYNTSHPSRHTLPEAGLAWALCFLPLHAGQGPGSNRAFQVKKVRNISDRYIIMIYHNKTAMRKRSNV